MRGGVPSYMARLQPGTEWCYRDRVRMSGFARSGALAVMVCALWGTVPASHAHGQEPPLNGGQRKGEVRALSTGKILVASRELRDPNFAESVVLLVEFSSKGAVGLILNRQTDVPVSRAFTGPEALNATRALLFLGGPVEVQGVLGLARGTAGSGDRHVLGDVYLVNSRESLDALIAGGA